MREKKGLYNFINKVLPGLSRLVPVLGISLLFIQFLWVPALAQKVEYHEGYDLIYQDDGSKDIINGDFNFLRWDGIWRPNDELNISNGSWPYLYSGNATTADFKANDTTLSIPKANTQFKLKQNSISYNLVYSKSELQGKEKSINLTDALIDFPYNLKSKKPKTEYRDQFNIKYDRFHFKAGLEHISIHDDTPRDYIEDGKVFQDVTYLFPGDYDFKIDNGQIRLKFKKSALNKLTGNIIIEINTWDVVGANNSLWGGNVTFNSTTEVRATGNVELRQKVDDYVLYTRFDEGSGNITHNENTRNVLEGKLEGDITPDTYTTGKYGKAIFFNGIYDIVHGNKVLFNDHPDFRMPYDFTISSYLYNTGYDNIDTDILRKGSTANSKNWSKLEVTDNIIHGDVQKYFATGNKTYQLWDTTERRDGNWHFITFTRQATNCELSVDGFSVSSSTCDTGTASSSTSKLSIGAKDTFNTSTGWDFIRGKIDDVRIYNRKLNSSELTSIQNNEHYPSGTVTRNLTSVILSGEELKELGCNGTWDSSISTVDIMASTNNITWDTIRSNATNNVLYNVSHNNNYKYTRCSLSTTNTSQTPIIESIRARISSSTIPPQPLNLQYTIGNYWVNHTWQAGTDVVTDAYNISVNGVWHNGTKPYYNDSAGASNWSNITVWAWNKSGSGNMSALSVSQNIQAPSLPSNSPINITSYSPLSPVNDNEGAIRTFNLAVNETVDMTWFINGTQVSSNSSVTAGNYTNTSAKSGTWNVSAVANNSNGSVVKTWIWIVSDLIANAGGPYAGTPGVLINFTGSASGGTVPYSYNWSFGDGQTSSLANPAHTYATPGSYTANLTVTDNAGTSYRDTAAVSVEWIRFINGTIMDSVNKTGLAGVKVFTNTSLSTVTNATGFYSFSVNSGTYNITATLEPIYYPNSTTVSLMSAVEVQNIELLKKPTGNITGIVNS